MPLPPCASSLLIRAQSARRTRKGVWCAAMYCSFAAVSTSSGYSYLGSFLVARALISSIFALMRSPSSGSDSATTSPPMFVTNAVRTTAPLAYVMFASQMMCVSFVVSAPENAVSDGAKMKNRMPRSR